MEPPGGHGVSLRPDPRARWPKQRAYLPLSPGPLRVGQENFEIHMHATPVGPSRVLCSSGPLEEFRSNTTWSIYLWKAPRGQPLFCVPRGPVAVSSHVWRPALLKAQDREIGPTRIVPPRG